MDRNPEHQLVRTISCIVCALVVGVGLSGCAPKKACDSLGDSQVEVMKPKADLVIINAEIWTGTRSEKDAKRCSSDCVAICGDVITLVGTSSEAKAWIGKSTEVIDAAGRRVIPGITDSHVHLIGGGNQLARLCLRNVGSREEFSKAVSDDAKLKRKGEWVLGGRWSVESWSNPEEPRKEWIDPATSDTPVYLTRMDYHQALVNSAALKLAGIDRSGPPDPEGGEIQRDPNTNEPTGILKEGAKELVSRLIPKPSPDQQYEALLRAMKHANEHGITSVHDMSQIEDLPIYERAEREGTLTLRIHCYVDVTDWQGYAERIANYDTSSDMVYVHGFKGFMDGSLGSRNAYMREPYSDSKPTTKYPRGQLTDFADPPEEFARLVLLADKRKLQIAVHAIGDEANHILLGAYEEALKVNGERDARHRVEHAQHLLPGDIERFGELGVVASMQPYHKADDGRYGDVAVGEERLKSSYAYRELVDSGALVTFGSDWPIVTLDPFAGVDSAVNAITLAGEVWLSEHSLTTEEAIWAYTVAPSHAVHQEDVIGTLEVGKKADIVILNADPFSIDKGSLSQVKPSWVIVDGKVVFKTGK